MSLLLLYGGDSGDGFDYAARYLFNGAVDAALTYTRASTATYWDSNSVMQTASVDEPRIDHDPTTGNVLGYLTEESRTNKWLNSEDITTGTASGCTHTANATDAPDGATTMDLMTEDTGASAHQTSFSFAAPAVNVKLAFGCFVQASGRTKGRLTLQDATTTANVANIDFTLSGAGTIDATSVGGVAALHYSSIRRIGSTDTYWVQGVATLSALATTGVNSILAMRDSGGSLSYTGDGSSGMYFWGGMLEENVDAPSVSYIPCGATATTRAADVLYDGSISGWYNASEGTLIVEASSPYFEEYDNSAFPYFVSLLNSGNGGERISIMHRMQFTGRQLLVRAAATTQMAINTATDLTDSVPTRMAIAYKVNDSNGAIDGTAFTADTTVALPTGVDQLAIGQGYGAVQPNCHIKEVAYLDYRVTDAELETLTSV